jgi:hypothetical protein
MYDDIKRAGRERTDTKEPRDHVELIGIPLQGNASFRENGSRNWRLSTSL